MHAFDAFDLFFFVWIFSAISNNISGRYVYPIIDSIAEYIPNKVSLISSGFTPPLEILYNRFDAICQHNVRKMKPTNSILFNIRILWWIALFSCFSWIAMSLTMISKTVLTCIHPIVFRNGLMINKWMKALFIKCLMIPTVCCAQMGWNLCSHQTSKYYDQILL